MQCRALETGLSDLKQSHSPTVPPPIMKCFAVFQVNSSEISYIAKISASFKHLLHLEKKSRLNPIFQDFAFNFHTFSRSGKVVRKFPDFFKNSRLCTNPEGKTKQNK